MYIQMLEKKPPVFTEEEKEIKLTKAAAEELTNGKGGKEQKK